MSPCHSLPVSKTIPSRNLSPLLFSPSSVQASFHLHSGTQHLPLQNKQQNYTPTTLLFFCVLCEHSSKASSFFFSFFQSSFCHHHMVGAAPEGCCDLQAAKVPTFLCAVHHPQLDSVAGSLMVTEWVGQFVASLLDLAIFREGRDHFIGARRCPESSTLSLTESQSCYCARYQAIRQLGSPCLEQTELQS